MVFQLQVRAQTHPDHQNKRLQERLKVRPIQGQGEAAWDQYLACHQVPISPHHPHH